MQLLKDWFITLSQVSFLYFFIAGTVFIVLYHFCTNYFLKQKIQVKFPNKTDYYREVKFSISTILIFTIISYWCFFTFKNYNTVIEGNIKDYGYLKYACSFGFMFIFHDAYFYFTHRLLHIPFLLKYVHVVHHKSTNPSPWTAYAFHPIEALIMAFVVPFYTFIFDIHITAFALFMLIQISMNVYAHSGFELLPNWLKNSSLGKLISSSTHHNLHHKSFKGNYGLYTLIWDKLFKTMSNK